MTPNRQINDSVPFQIGHLTTNLEAVILSQKRLGVGPWVTSGWRTGAYYDGERYSVVYPRLQIGLGRWTADICLEFIQPDSDTKQPWAWDASRVETTSHLGYWCHDVVLSAQRLVQEGFRLITAKLPDNDVEATAKILQRGEWPKWLPMVYLIHPTGTLVELVAAELWPQPFIAQYGPAVRECVSVPPMRQ